VSTGLWRHIISEEIPLCSACHNPEGQSGDSVTHRALTRCSQTERSTGAQWSCRCASSSESSQANSCHPNGSAGYIVWGWSGWPWSKNHACDLQHVRTSRYCLLGSVKTLLTILHTAFSFQVGYLTKLKVWRLRVRCYNLQHPKLKVWRLRVRCYNLQHHIKNIHNHKKPHLMYHFYTLA
jgi:hypothetical protein